MVTHAGERGAHVSTIALARPHPCAPSSGLRASALPPSRRRARPRPCAPGGSRRSLPPPILGLPGAAQSHRPLAEPLRGPPVSRGRLPRHGPGPRLTMAAARHSTLDFMLGAKGEDTRPPPAPPPPPPGEPGPGEAHAAAEQCALRDHVHRRPRGRPRSHRAPLRPGRSAGPGGAAPGASSQPSLPLGPGSPSSPPPPAGQPWGGGAGAAAERGVDGAGPPS